jgi:hypothetical protein
MLETEDTFIQGQNGDILWLIQHGQNGEWTLLNPEWCKELEQYISAQSQARDWIPLPKVEHWYLHGRRAWKRDFYTLDPWSMTQTNNTSGTVRPLLRCVVQAPPTFEEVFDEVLGRQDVAPSQDASSSAQSFAPSQDLLSIQEVQRRMGGTESANSAGVNEYNDVYDEMAVMIRCNLTFQ